jgi:cytochrome P450
MTFQGYDLKSIAFYTNPYPVYKVLQADDPVHWSADLGCWLITRYDDVLAGLRDPRLSSAKMPSFTRTLPEEVQLEIRPFVQYLSSFLGLSDPPDHSRLRKLVNKAFTPNVVLAMRQRIQETVERLMMNLVELDNFDLIGSFAFPLPATVITAVIGVPADDLGQFKRWSDDIVAFIGGSRADADQAIRGQVSMMEMIDYYRGLLAERRRMPATDLISALLMAEEAGQRLSEEELLATCVTLLAGGHETTTNLLANGMLALIQNPTQLEKLRSEPAMIQTAIEELLRYDSPVQRAERVARLDLEIGGKRIKAGDRMLLVLGAANRDGSQFPEPDSLLLNREPNRHLAFGFGTHFCIGAPLARLEAEIAFQALLQRLPRLAIESQGLEWYPSVGNRGMKSMPVTRS